MLELWEIILPLQDNAGKPYAHEHSEVCVLLLEAFGGYTSFKANGGWLDGVTVYEEDVMVYRFLCESEPAINWLWSLFPDQKALYVAKVGRGRIVSR
ncbi:hypothetical protein UFOVP134_37 [uncultured Caudovirales phage]|uniref:Uncharacterized protein n=1 Tax=uncultured Caudovirales phage TaxID=2100421 RepID=A0A6J5LG83_9CAUD|nr:hypothetical protein UFOVP134_37 [uncultured Caudovirales phage]